MTDAEGLFVGSPQANDDAGAAQPIGLVNFINAYAQFSDATSLPNIGSILLIGVGQGLEPAVLRWRGYNVTTFDIDARLRPDATGSVHDLSRYGDGEFDLTIASHVLEHLPIGLLDSALAELSRVSRFSLVYLPINGPHIELKLKTNYRDFALSRSATFAKFLSRPDPTTPRYMEGHHYWEIGVRGFRLRDVRSRLTRQFDIIREYRNPDWLVSYNFVLRSRRTPR